MGITRVDVGVQRFVAKVRMLWSFTDIAIGLSVLRYIYSRLAKRNCVN